MTRPVVLCKVDGCDSLGRAVGMCGRHYQLMRRYGSTADRPHGRRPRTQGTCMSCSEPARSRNMCTSHYARWLRTGNDRTAICTVEDCSKPLYSNGLCSNHYQRVRNHGSFDDLRTRPAADRFWEKVNKTADCWLWTGGTTNEGYGVFWDGSRNTMAHRWAYEDAVGPIPDGLHLDHLCHTPPCVRPVHLEPVTPRENMRRGFKVLDLGTPPHCPTCSCKDH